MKSASGDLKENISLFQLLVLILNFGLGSTIVLGLGNEAKQDSWLADIIASVFGIGAIWFFYRFNMQLPAKDLFQILEWAYGRILAVVLAICYVTYFFYLSCLVLRDFGELMATTVLPNTPIEIVSLCLMLLISYMVYLGIEVVARTSEIFSPYLYFFFFVLGLLLIIGSQFHIRNLLPVLSEGFKPIFKALFPSMLTFPFGEMILFTIIMAQVTKIKYAGKTAIIAIFALGFFLTFSVIIQLGTLGVDQRVRSNFPLLSAAREISIAQFIERLDSLVVFIMMLGIVVKINIAFYGGLKGLEYIFKTPYRSFVFPVAMIITLFSIMHADNFTEHFVEGVQFEPLYLCLPLQFGVPIMTYAIVWWKKKKSQSME